MTVGLSEGLLEGAEDGLTVGLNDGVSEGESEGYLAGVGAFVGISLDNTVGAIVKATAGAQVGLFEMGEDEKGGEVGEELSGMLIISAAIIVSIVSNTNSISARSICLLLEVS